VFGSTAPFTSDVVDWFHPLHHVARKLRVGAIKS
jgi:hypothetical protein